MKLDIILFYLFVLFLYFPIKLQYVGVETGRLVIWTVTLFLALQSDTLKLMLAYKFSKPFVFLLIGHLAGIFLLSIYHNFIEVTFILFYVEKFVLLPLMITTIIKLNRLTFSQILNILIAVIFTQILVIMLNILAPFTRDIMSVLINSGVPKDTYSFRHLGITGFLSYSNGFLLFLALPISLVTRRKFHFLVAALSFALAISFSRSSLLIFGVFILIVIFDSLIRVKVTKAGLKIALLAVLSFVTLLLTMIYFIPPDILEWIFDIILMLAKGKLPEGLSVLSQQIWDPGVETLAFGDGRLQDTNGGYYMHTDVGYMRYILYFGVIGTLIHHIVIYYFFFLNMQFHNYFIRLAFGAYLISILVITYKGNFIMDTWGLIAAFLLLSTTKNEDRV